MADTPSLADRMYPQQAENAGAAASSPANDATTAEKSIADRMYPVEAAREAADTQKAAQDGAAKPADGETKDAAASHDTKTPEQIDEAAQQLATDLKLDSADPMSAAFAKEAVSLGLDKDGAEKMAQLHYQHQVDRWEAQRAEWRKEASAIPQAENEVAAANAVLKRFGDAKLGAFLAQGYGDNPVLIAFLARVGRALG